MHNHRDHATTFFELATDIIGPVHNSLAADLRARTPALIDGPLGEPLDDLCRRFVADLIRLLTDAGGEEQCRADDAARDLVTGDVEPEEAVDAFRRCAHATWDCARTLAREQDPGVYLGMLERAGDIWIEYEHWTSAVAEAYRAEARHRDRLAAQEREAHVAALLTGAGGSQVELRRSADALGLPKSGYFCVVVAERCGEPPMDAEPTLRVRGLPSVWNMTLLEQTGVISLGTPDRAARVRDLLAQHAAGRVGMSTTYDQLGHTPLAARLAHVALAALPPGARQVSVYGDRPLETLVASAPETARDMALSVLGKLLAAPADDQKVLLDTLDVWCAAGGNVNRTAELLHCHRNTVRHRLTRIEALTGRSLAEPRGVAEMLTAVQAYRLHIGESGLRA
jgi:PucR-like helix-turn-helix protein/diguanylate cyclase with GGDEF domain